MTQLKTNKTKTNIIINPKNIYYYGIIKQHQRPLHERIVLSGTQQKS